MNMSDYKRHITPIEKGLKYKNKFYGSNNDIILKDRLIVDFHDLESIDSSSDENKQKLKDSFERLNIKNYPFKLIEHISFDRRVKYLKDCVGFVRMRGYEMIKYLLSVFPKIKVDTNHKYGKKDFKYDSDNLMTFIFRNYDSNLVLDWLWIVSNLSAIFLTHNTKYASLKIEDISNNIDIIDKLEDIEEELNESDAKNMLKTYEESTAPDIKVYDMIIRTKWFSNITEKINKISKLVPNPKNNTLYNQAVSGSKGNVDKFDHIYKTIGPLQNPISVLPITLNNQVQVHDDYYDMSRYGIIKNSLANGLTPREYSHLFNIVHIALQQTPLQTKVTGSVEKGLTPFMQNLFLRNGALENDERKLLPGSFD